MDRGRLKKYVDMSDAELCAEVLCATGRLDPLYQELALRLQATLEEESHGRVD